MVQGHRRFGDKQGGKKKLDLIQQHAYQKGTCEQAMGNASYADSTTPALRLGCSHPPCIHATWRYRGHGTVKCSVRRALAHSSDTGDMWLPWSHFDQWGKGSRYPVGHELPRLER